MEQFIEKAVDIVDKTSAEWHKFANLTKEQLRDRWQTPIGKGLISALKSKPFSREHVKQYLGSFAGKLDCRGIDLAGHYFHGADCRDIDFFGANLSGADFAQANLAGSFLSESDVRRTKFDWSNMDKALLDNIEFDNDTSFSGVNLNEVNFTLAVLVQDLAVGQQRITHLEVRHPLFAWFLRVTTDYGRSFQRYVLWVICIIGLYAILYWRTEVLKAGLSFLDCLYFSLVTFTTVGYGDITPETQIARAIVCTEIALGYVMGGLLVAILAKRMMASQ